MLNNIAGGDGAVKMPLEQRMTQQNAMHAEHANYYGTKSIRRKKMYKIVICDDDKNYIEELKSIIIECNDDERALEFFEYHSGEELLEGLPQDSDALFLDIQLSGMDGNEVAVRVGERGYQGLLIQCSGVFLPTPETIKISPYRFLLKQSSREASREEMQEIFEEMDRLKACFTLEASYRRKKAVIRTMDVAYITHHKKGSILHLNKERQKEYAEGSLIAPYYFDELLERLSLVGFACPHNSYLVNLRYVTKFLPNKEAIMVDGKNIAVARGRVEQFKKDFIAYVDGKYKEKLR